MRRPGIDDRINELEVDLQTLEKVVGKTKAGHFTFTADVMDAMFSIRCMRYALDDLRRLVRQISQ
jgi:hypothetical protein